MTVSVEALLRKPSGFLPLAMSSAALLLLLLYVATVGVEPQPDEGAAAHLWQLLIGGQAPFVLGFLATADWERWQRVAVAFALQVGALAVALFPVAYFRL